jgi:predicted nucleotidyltransferase
LKKQKFTLSDKKKIDKIFKNKSEETEIEKQFYKKTEKYLKFIKWIPGLRMVGIGNSVSMNSASKNSDIDLLIVTDKNRMWLVRILVTLIFQIL